jgi:hypothetical protein
MPSRISTLDQDYLDLRGDRGHFEDDLQKRSCELVARLERGIEKQSECCQSMKCVIKNKREKLPEKKTEANA